MTYTKLAEVKEKPQPIKRKDNKMCIFDPKHRYTVNELKQFVTIHDVGTPTEGWRVKIATKTHRLYLNSKQQRIHVYTPAVQDSSIWLIHKNYIG